jgi:hypothetical protein
VYRLRAWVCRRRYKFFSMVLFYFSSAICFGHLTIFGGGGGNTLYDTIRSWKRNKIEPFKKFVATTAIPYSKSLQFHQFNIKIKLMVHFLPSFHALLMGTYSHISYPCKIWYLFMSKSAAHKTQRTTTLHPKLIKIYQTTSITVDLFQKNFHFLGKQLRCNSLISLTL